MLYTSTRPTYQGDRIRLFPDLASARAEVGDGSPLFRVAVRFDHRSRRVFPEWTSAQVFDPAWNAPAEAHADGSITARAPIPSMLFGG